MEMSGCLKSGPITGWRLRRVLIGIEMVMPTQYLIWPGIAAVVTGLLAAFVDIGWAGQLAVFAVLSAVLVVASHYLPKQPLGDVSSLNQRTDHIDRASSRRSRKISVMAKVRSRSAIRAGRRSRSTGPI